MTTAGVSVGVAYVAKYIRSVVDVGTIRLFGFVRHVTPGDRVSEKNGRRYDSDRPTRPRSGFRPAFSGPGL